MARRLVPITLDNLDDVPAPCRSCAFWERGTRVADQPAKDDWVASVLLEWGRCGRLLYVDGAVAGFALYAPSRFVAASPALATPRPSPDAVVVMTARILPEYSHSGLGRVLMQSVVKDGVRRRGVRALEAYGDLRGVDLGCVIPAGFLTAVGFKTVRPHPRYPLLRLEMRSVLSWPGEMELAVEKWLGQLRPDGAPVGAVPGQSPRAGSTRA